MSLTDVQTIFAVISTMHDVYLLVVGNRERCTVLYNRCKAFEQQLQTMQSNLGWIASKSVALQNLYTTLNECVGFMNKYGKPGFKRFILNIAGAADIEATFNELNIKLTNSAVDLQLEIAINNTSIAAANKTDGEELLSITKELILCSNQGLANKVDDLQKQIEANSQEQMKVLSDQFKELLQHSKMLMELVHHQNEVKSLAVPRVDQGEQARTPIPSPMSVASCSADEASVADATLSKHQVANSYGSLSFPRLKLNLLRWDAKASKVLGKGEIATVYRCEYDGQPRALKHFENIATVTAHELKQIKREAAIMHCVQHENVLGFTGLCIEQGILVMELAMASVFDVLYRGIVVANAFTLTPIAAKISVLRDVSRALRYLHNYDIIHRDLKAQNILLVAGGDGSVTAKLGDFGVAVVSGITAGSGRRSDRGLSGKSGKLASDLEGGRQYAAPELLAEGAIGYSTAVDIYSFGILLNELMSGVAPWCGVSDIQLMRRIAAHERPDPFRPTTSCEMRLLELLGDATSGCWAHVPAKRPIAVTVNKLVEEVMGYVELNSAQTGRQQSATPSPPSAADGVEVITRRFEDGAFYEGETLNGVLHGRGKLVFPDGSSYEGHFENEMFNGHGTYVYKDGDVYEGEWKDDLKHGKGVHKLSNGTVYDGDFHNDKMDGIGVYRWPNHNVYEGEFQNGVMSGIGTFHFHNGNQYTGHVQGGMRHGSGTMKYASGDVYVGAYDRDQMHGRGVYTYAEGDTYEGDFCQGKMDGSGLFTYASGDRYEGGFRNDMRHGKGILYDATDNSWFSVQFDNDEEVGDRVELRR